MLSKLGAGLYRARWLVVVASLLVVAGMAVYGSGLFGFLKSGGFTDPASKSTRAQALLDSRLGGSTPDVIVLMSSQTLNVTDPAFKDAALQVISTLQARHEVASVTSYYSTLNARLLSKDGHETFALVQMAAKDELVKEKDFKTI